MTAEETPAPVALNCPRDQTPLEPVSIGPVEIARCSTCGGTWYPRDRLRTLKDHESHGDYRWIDVDVWKEEEQFGIEPENRYRCPLDGAELSTVRYGETNLAVDICEQCEGLWLDRGEYEAILEHLAEKVDASDVGDYVDDLREELVEVLHGTEEPTDEVRDLSKVMYLLELRWFVEHPRVKALVDGLRIP